MVNDGRCRFFTKLALYRKEWNHVNYRKSQMEKKLQVQLFNTTSKCSLWNGIVRSTFSLKPFGQMWVWFL